MNAVQLVACGLIMSLVLVRTEARPTTPSQHKVRLWVWDLCLLRKFQVSLKSGK